MTFESAYESLKEGRAVKRAGWLGYWISDGVNVLIHCKDGSIVSMVNGCNPMFTLSHCVADDWLTLTDEQRSELDRVHHSHILTEEVAK